MSRVTLLITLCRAVDNRVKNRERGEKKKIQTTRVDRKIISNHVRWDVVKNVSAQI